MIQYRLLNFVQRGRPPIAFGVAFRDAEGEFLFVPEWRSPQPLPVKDLRDLNESHIPKTVYALQWAGDVGEWEESPEEEFDPMAVLSGSTPGRKTFASGELHPLYLDFMSNLGWEYSRLDVGAFSDWLRRLDPGTRQACERGFRNGYAAVVKESERQVAAVIDKYEGAQTGQL